MYRLDRLTSGLVILGKNLKAALMVDQHIKDRTAEKTYLCRVGGDFPSGKITVDQRIDCAIPKIGVHWINDDTGKLAVTEFEKVSFNGKTSLVKCYPKTGRTHQIRIHLQYLGYPIVNDPLYNQPLIWGENNGKDAAYKLSREEIEQNFYKTHSYEAWVMDQEQEHTGRGDETTDEATTSTTKAEPATSKVADEEDTSSNSSSSKRKSDERIAETNKESVSSNKKLKLESNDEVKSDEDVKDVVPKASKPASSGDNLPGFDKSLLENDPDCFECQNVFKDPKREDVIMFLHAYSYKFENLKFQTELPEWALDSYKD